jgi:formate hydrogenlyase transcriptional activator
MKVHPGPEKLRVPAVKLAELEPIRRALQDNEDWYEDVVEHSHDLLCIHDLAGRLLAINSAPARLLGYSVEEILQTPMRELMAPEFRDQFDAYLDQIERAGEARGLLAVMTRSGERRIWEYHNTLRTEGVESPVVRGVAHDVTELKRAEKLARQASEAMVQDITERRRAEQRLGQYERVVESVEEMIAVVDREYRYVIANAALLNNRGIEREQIIGRSVAELTGKEAFEKVFKPKLDECFQGKVVRFDLNYNYPNLGERDLLISYFPIEGPTGIDRIAAIVLDVTEREQAEEALREAKEFSENLIRTANVMVLALDTGGNITLFNQAAEEITGYTFSELKGKSWSILVPRDRFPHVWEEFDRLMDGTAGPTFENPIITKTGEERYIAWRNSVVKINGRVAATISFGNDITTRRQAEQALRRSEESYRMFVSESSEGIYREEMDAPVSIDLPEDELVHHILHDSHIVECNDALAAMYGLTSAKELWGKHWAEMMPPDEPQNVEMTRQFVRSGFRVLERQSHEVDIHGNPKIFLNSLIGTVENGMLVRTWGIQRDITERVKLEEGRQKAEEALRENVAQLQEVTEELRQAKEKLSEEKLYLEEAIDAELGFGEIIGQSSALRDVMAKVTKVAPSDATVLLLGETGTGKELVARALHRMSQREGNSFIKLNCAAIPSGLLESELFGHEKGAFTGAVARKHGRLELADRGTLFLDEIGEIPLSLQPKLLRVLQDMEFERLGGTQTLKVNFRLLAATNRDLLQSVKAHEFRSDLYYRLNVFPILIPPLRERREDIRPLVEHFVRKFAGQMRKSITSIPSRSMETLVRWVWPGNIRELENFIERSVILTPGSVLQAPLSELQTAADRGNGETKDKVRDKERERILRVLRDCRGQLGGPNGAAARLGLPRTTLQSKLDHLGIKPAAYRA